MKSKGISSLLGESTNLLWDELADEAKGYLELIERLRTLPADAPERERLEAALYLSLSHLAVHASTLDESVTEALLREAERAEGV